MADRSYIWIHLGESLRAQVLNVKQKDLLAGWKDFDPSKKYLLICDQGFQSRRVAKRIWEAGGRNFFALRRGWRGVES